MSTFAHLRLRNKLDRAIIASVAAMLAMNMFVLAGQLQPAQAFAMAQTVEAIRA